MPRYLREPPRFEIQLPRAGQVHALVRVAAAPLTWVDTERGLWFEVPPGFVSDGASVPAPLWPVLEANWIDLLLPGFAHDYCYRSDARVIDIPSATLRPIERDEADEVIRDLARHVGVGASDQQKIFFSVRVAGWTSFRKRPVAWRP